jgi:Outer membrane protein beta-barrel domain
MISRTRMTALSAAVLAAMASTSVLAQDAAPGTGFYVGAALTQSRFDSNNFAVSDIDNEDNSWKAIVGVRMMPQLAFEANYINFGKSTAPSVSAGGPFVADADGFALYGVGLMPVGPVELFLKAGVSRIDAKGNVGAVFYEDKATQFAYGGGVQLRLGSFALRAEYEKFNTDVIGDLDLISVGFTYTFASNY